MQQSTGQTAAHASFSWKPTHSVQSRGSMTKMSSPWLMAWFGHSGSQAPQLMHSSVIVVAMFLESLPLRQRFQSSDRHRQDHLVPGGAQPYPEPVRGV